MRYRITAAAIVVAAVLVSSFGFASARDTDVGAVHNGLSICEESYLAEYAKVQNALGDRTPGRNFVADGIVKDDGSVGPIHNQRACHEVEDLKAMLAPPPAPPTTEAVAPATTAPTSTTTATPTSGSYTIPSDIVACESGGDYSASNASGAYGAYQIMPATAANYGCDLSTASGQDSCAAAIYADVGSSAWDCG